MLCFPRVALAHECDWDRGPLGVCPCDSFGTANAAVVETTTWMIAGGGWERAHERTSSLGVLGVGAEATLGPVLRYSGFPANERPHDAELRAGVWAVGVTRFDGALLEGGVKAHLGAIEHAQWGTIDLRVGAGYGAFDTGRAAHFVATFAWGTRSFLARYGRCGTEPHDRPKRHGFGSIVRPFVTLRQAADRDPSTQLTFGIELSPTFLLPPYSWWRLAGGPDN
ncbi:MAG: hypothetical protein JWM74_4482 [Myxococcaceae bacterium]|nr:hypothetical protein [Myxococcaceae bacterium]